MRCMNSELLPLIERSEEEPQTASSSLRRAPLHNTPLGASDAPKH